MQFIPISIPYAICSHGIKRQGSNICTDSILVGTTDIKFQHPSRYIYIWIELLQYKQLRTPRRDALICVHTSLQIQPTVWAGIGRCYSPQTKSSSSYIRKNSVILLQMWRCANIVLTKFSVELLLNSPLKLPHLMPDGIYC